MSGDLNGITVVSVEQAVAAPYASVRLADAGARVIKVERPEGDFARNYDTFANGNSAYFVWLNRGKESVCLDLRVETDRNLLHAMVAKADVFIQNLKPGSLAKLGFPMARLRRDFPAIICCTITGFGETGPYADLKAYDLIVQAETGLCSITGTSDGPARVGVSVCDIAAGLTAHSAILQALFKRERTGVGALIEVSLFDALADWMNVPYLQYAYGGHATKRAGVNHPSIAPYGAYTCSDGLKVVFSVQNSREWTSFCEHLMGSKELAIFPDFATNMMRLKHRAALDGQVQARFDQLGSSEAMALLEAAGIAYGRLNSIPELAEHPHLRRFTIDTPTGPLHLISPGAIVDNQEPERRFVPAKGQHTDAIRKEFESP
ncbi:CaiB/BaiF CoA-transferase family protein [Sphingomonas sp. 28-63-12]|uniref:CaiB/BaiF CoA transferase family protein n=1 Tax=Sphingomonas sp. 28-63-12 TaxID=1970434 RepID=UPI000BCE671C|nr:MAG: carnitine dehydratase [Sphingomonas sp. 28-63-12]